MTLFVIDNALPWSQILLIALIGISIVFVVLLLLVYVMRLFGFVFTRGHKANNAKVPVAISDEEVVAIVTALKLYKAALHDQESDMLTINRMTRMYSPWNSKIHGLTPCPERIRRK